MAKKSNEELLQEQLDAANAKIEALTAEVADSKRAAWREPDYTGPLTADQAAWRNVEFKPAEEDTKPAKEVVTK